MRLLGRDGDDLLGAGARPPTRSARDRRRRRRHLRRQPQHQLHQRLLRRLPVLRLQAPALGGATPTTTPIDDVLGKVAGGDRARRHRGLHAGRHQPRDARRSRYRDILVRDQDARSRDLHMHAFSPMEIMYGARRTGMSYRDYLAHAARRRPRHASRARPPRSSTTRCARSSATRRSTCAPGSRSSPPRTALGMPTTSTVMYGHVETPGHVARHSTCSADPEARPAASPSSCRSASSQNTQLYRDGLVAPPPKGVRDLRMYAVEPAHAARLDRQPADLVGEARARAGAAHAARPAATTSAAR